MINSYNRLDHFNNEDEDNEEEDIEDDDNLEVLV